MALIAILTIGAAYAQVPADIEAKLLKIRPIVDPACTAKIYRPLMPPKEVADQYLEMEKTTKPSNQVPLYSGIMLDSAKTADGKGHCPMLVVMKGESHMSEPFSVDSSDKNVSGPILAWIKSVK